MPKPGLRRLGDRRRIPERRVLPVVDAGDDLRHPFLEADYRLPAELGGDLADVGVRAFGFARPLRDVDFLAAEQFDQTVYRLRIAGAQIPDLSDGGGLRRCQERA